LRQGRESFQFKKYLLIFAPLFTAFLIVFLFDLTHGSVQIPLKDIIAVLTGGSASKASWGSIILALRLPRAFTASLAGASLAVSGLLMQTLFRNPLAGPFVLGINSGASLGVALVILAAGTGIGGSLFSGGGIFAEIGLVAAASIGSALVLGIVLLAARRISSNTVILIMGIMFGYAVSAVVSVLIHFSFAERVQSFIAWSFGSFAVVSAKDLGVMFPVILLCLFLALPLCKQLNALVLGETYASSMGVSVLKVRMFLISVAAVLAGTVTAFCGPVAFIGIAVPHLARNILRSGDHRILIPGCILTGGIIALAADIASNLPGSDMVLPLNSVTSLIGAPIVIWVIMRYQHVGR